MNGHHPQEVSSATNGYASGGSGTADLVSGLEGTDRLWQRLVHDYPYLLKERDDMKEIRKQLMNREIIICVFGRHNCGKSTLLNAMLANSCLPTDILNETGVQVKIKHDSAVHHGYCTPECQGSCPRLVDETTKELIATGADDINNKLTVANKHHRMTGILVQKSYILYAHVPMLARAPAGWQLAFVDTPGFGEANMDNITSISKKLLTTSSAYLYIIDVTSVGDETDAINMKCLFERDQGVFSQHRIVVAVNKYDLYLEKSSGKQRRTRQRTQQQNKPDLHKIICDQIKESTGVECPREIVVPVSAEWAEQARELRQDPNDEGLQDDVTRSLRIVPDSPRGQGEAIARTRFVERASQLEVSCGIIQLEDRLRETVDHCMQCWVSSLVSGYVYHLSKAQGEMEKFRNTKKQEHKDHQDMLKKHADYKDAKENFLGKSFVAPGETLPIKRDLENKFDTVDIPIAKQFIAATLTDLVERFKSEMKMRIMDSQLVFGENAMTDSIKKFVLEEVQPRLSTILKGLRLDGVPVVFREYQQTIEADARRVEIAALECLPSNWNAVDNNFYEERKRVIPEVGGGALFEQRELTVEDLQAEGKPTIPKIELKRMQKVWDAVKRFFGLKVERPYKEWNEDLDVMIAELHSSLTAQAENYIQSDLRNWILELLAGTYSTQVKIISEGICRTFDPDIRREKDKIEGASRECTGIIEALGKDIDEISKQRDTLSAHRIF